MAGIYELNKLKGKDIFSIIDENKDKIDDYFWKYYENFTTEKMIPNVKNICEFFNPYGKLLSIGCGHGLIEMYISDMCKDIENVKGIDIIESKINSMNEIINLFDLKNVIGIHGNGMSIEFPDQSFDTVLIIESLSHADDQERVLKEAVRVLKKGGSIFVLDFNNGANPRIWIRSWKQRHFEDTIENVVNPYFVKNRLLDMDFKDIIITSYRFSRSFGYLKERFDSKNVNLPSKFYIFVSNGFMLKAVKQ
jgi:ubiquinone/menaquinone biosynthesis C-methylase UbiE